MQSESSEYVCKTTGFFSKRWRIQEGLESYSDERTKEVWERNWMNLEVQTALLITHPPKLLATTRNSLREQLKENNQLNAVE